VKQIKEILVNKMMKIAKFFLLSVGLFFAASAQAILPIQHWTTAQGVRVYFVEAPTIPMLDVQIDFDAGNRFDKKEKAGVSDLANAMLGKGIAAHGSSAGLNESQIAEGFANLGALRGGSASEDRASITLRTLSSEPERVEALSLLAQLVAYPSFPENVLSREKERLMQAIKEAETKPETIANKAFSSLLYGNHPYGFDGTTASIASISIAELKQFYANYYTRDRVVVSMVGAISRAQAEKIAEQLTMNLKPKGILATPMPAVVKPAAADKRIEHPASQSHIFVGTTGIARGNPDYFSLLVANYSLGGGGFVSRLYKEVRENRGLAYSVYSYFGIQSQEGPFTIGLQTKREETANALNIVKDTLSKFVDGGPTAEETDAAKSNLIGGFALRIDNNRKILDNVAAVGFYQLPLDYLDTWTSKIQSVTREQAHAAFRKYVDPKQMVTVVVGNAK
jgi:zinc protease